MAIRENTLIADGDMEAEDTGSWYPYGAAAYIKDQSVAYNGSQSMLIISSGIQQRFLPVEAGNTYRLVIHYRRVSGRVVILLGRNTSNSDSFGGGLSDSSSATDPWRTYSRLVTMPDDLLPTDDIRLVIYGNANVDDVQMSSTELIRDWNAEAAGMGTWLAFGVPAALEKVSEGAFSGNRSIRLSEGGVQQLDIPVEAGKTYDLSLWHQLNAGTLRVRLGLNSSNYDFEGGEYITGRTGGWTRYTRTFTVPDGYLSTSSFRLIIFASGAGSEVLLDNISIRPH